MQCSNENHQSNMTKKGKYDIHVLVIQIDLKRARDYPEYFPSSGCAKYKMCNPTPPAPARPCPCPCLSCTIGVRLPGLQHIKNDRRRDKSFIRSVAGKLMIVKYQRFKTSFALANTVTLRLLLIFVLSFLFVMDEDW